MESILKDVRTFGDLQKVLGYKSFGGFENLWKDIYPNGKVFQHETLPTDSTVKNFLQAATLPKQGRSKKVMEAAFWLLEGVAPEKENFEIEKCVPKPTPKPPTRPNPIPTGTIKTKTFSMPIFVKKFGVLDVVFFLCAGIGAYGFYFFLSWVGAVIGVVYLLIGYSALVLAKDRHAQNTSRNAIAAIWVFESVAVLVDWFLMNHTLYQDPKKLPFNSDVITWGVFVVALVVALIISAAAIYAATTIRNTTIEKVDALRIERDGNIY